MSPTDLPEQHEDLEAIGKVIAAGARIRRCTNRLSATEGVINFAIATA
jgi:hypothetical protein